MKKNQLLFSALFCALIAFGCSKEIDNSSPESVTPGKEEVTPVPGAKLTTISATLVHTKVTFDPSFYTNHSPMQMDHRWEEGDKLRVTEVGNDSNTGLFDLVDGYGSATARFEGSITEAAAYNIEVVPAGTPSEGDEQNQAGDASTSHLKFVAGAANVEDLSNVALTESSSIIGFIVKLPADVTETISQVVIEKSTDDFATKSALTINLGETLTDVNDDDILEVYANIPSGWEIADGTKMFLKFNAPGTDHTVYTRYQEFATALVINPGQFNYIKINASESDKHAGPVNAANGTDADNAYLIADKYQLASINILASTENKTYFKVIDNIDADGEDVDVNKGVTDYAIVVDFNGNNKTISNLDKDLFYVFKGSIYDLTLDNCNVSSRGILAEYIQGTGHTITNVKVTNGSVNSSQSNVGGLIGYINNGSGTCATITDCEVSNTNVSGVGVVGGVIGFADQLIIMTGCNYVGGTVTATARYAGGLIASTANHSSVISDCFVENAIILSSSDRVGGLIGMVQTKVRVEGCAVGSSLQKVTVNSTQTAATANVGGFVGVNYGRITKKGDVRSQAFVTVTSSNVTAKNSMQIGGFVGYNTGTIEYSDVDVMMEGLMGQYIGGFCGVLLSSGKIENSTETGSVSGNNYTGGFVGVVDNSNASVSYCSSAGTISASSSIGGFAGGCSSASITPTFTGNSSSVEVTSNGSNAGGFIGNCAGTFTSNYATGDVSATGGNCGGFAGGIWESSTGSTFSKNYAIGDVSGTTNCGGLIGYIGGDISISDCYATGKVGTSTKYSQKYGGLVGFTSDSSTNITSGVSISNCYASGDIESSFAGAGLVGRIGMATTSVSNCAAWNSKVYPHSAGSENWSSAAVVGVAFPKCTLTDNYRNPSMNLTAYWVPAMDTFQHANVSSSHPLTDSAGQEMEDTSTGKGQAHYPQYPYHGKVEAGKTLSELASTTLGWSSDVWDFSADLPTLK